MLKAIKTLRKELHAHPELSGKEVQTAMRICKFINTHHPTKIIKNLGGTGLAAIYEFGEGPTVMIRCELDALPISDPNTYDYKSTQDGVSHKCGHDGHMAIVTGLIFWLKTKPKLQGKVVLLFQPAEETGKGAEMVLKDSRFLQLQPDYVFALHNIPGVAMHQIIPIDSNFSPAVQSVAIFLEGKVSHACEPEKGVNPAVAVGKLIEAFERLSVKDSNHEDFCLFTPVHINLGEIAYGISAGKAEIHYTFRTWDNQKITDLKKQINSILKQISKSENLSYSLDWFDYFPAAINTDFCNEIVIKSAQKNGFDIQKNAEAFKFGEDFGWFSKHYNAAMFGLGAGLKTPALHHANYDFPEELLQTGIQMFQGILTEVLEQ